MADGEGDKHYCPLVFLEFRDEGMYLLVLASRFSSHPRSRQNPISAIIRVHSFSLKEVGSGEGESGIPLGVYEVRRCAMTRGIKLLDFLERENPFKDTAGG